MNKNEIEKAFIGRWRIYGLDDAIKDNAKVKEYAIKFFEAGVLLGEGGHEATYSEVCDYNAPFEEFWCAYDKKVGRPKCEKLWSKLTMAERVACLNYIPLYKQAQPEKCYRKNPETFLRNKCWNDELIYHDNGNKSTDNQQRNDKLADILVG